MYSAQEFQECYHARLPHGRGLDGLVFRGRGEAKICPFFKPPERERCRSEYYDIHRIIQQGQAIQESTCYVGVLKKSILAAMGRKSRYEYKRL